MIPACFWAARIVSGNASGASLDLQFLLTLLRRQEEVTFTRTRLEIEPLNLPSFTLTLEQGRLNGFEGDNGLTANATLTANDIVIPIELQIETTENATGLNRVYFRHGEIDLAPWTKNIIEQISESTVSGEYWLTLQGDEWLNMTARIASPNFVFHGQYDDIEVRDSKVEAYIENKGNGFESWLNVLGYTLNNKTFGSTQGKFSSRAGRAKLQWDSLPVDLVGHWLSLEDPNSFWQGIKPSGFLEQGYLTISESDPNSIIAQATVTDFSMRAHQSVPGMDNLFGTIRVEGSAGKLELTSEKSRMQFASLYDTPFDAQIDSASLTWYTQPNIGLFSAGKADVRLSPVSDLTTQTLPLNVQWQTVNPVLSQRQLGRESTLELNVAAQEMSKGWAIELSKNNVTNDSVSQLLEERLEEGQFSETQLTYLVGAELDKPAYSQIFLLSQFDQIQMSFLDDWESIGSLSGSLNLDKKGLTIEAINGVYPGFDVPKLSMWLGFDDYQMDVSLEANADSSAALNFLQTGPLRPIYGDNFDTWSVQGSLNLQAEIGVPISAPEDFTAHVDIEVENNAVAIEPIAMQFTDANGQISYDTATGLASNGLTVRHLGRLQNLKINSGLSSTNSNITIAATGETSVRYWGERFNDRFLANQDATIQHTTNIEIFPSKVTIRSKSDLNGVELPFPAPFNKSADESLALSLAVDLDERDWTIVRANLGDKLVSFFEMNQDNDIKRGSVAINRPLNVRQENGVFFDINVDQADGDDWWQAIQQMRALYAQESTDGNGVSFESLIQSIQIEASSLEYLAQPWTSVKATLLRNENAWIVSFNADEGQGQVLVPHNNEPIFAQMNWLSMTTGEDDIAFADEVDPLLSYLPSDVPNMQLQISKLIWNGRDMGNWRTEIEVSNGQLNARNIVGEMNGATMSGSLLWELKNNKHKTKFVGSIAIGNLLDVLETWQYAPVLTSRSGTVNVDAFWQGSPAFFDFKRLQGAIRLSLRKGAILQVDEYEGIKLIGLLNFTRVIQRIALDFSDLLQSGITYDTIEGELLFDRGFARVGEKLVIDGSATKFKFSGDADLLSDELDIDMVLTVPLSSTFPLVALLAGVTPQAAAAIYVTERVFNNELERLSSARMHITGSFEAPDTKFYRVFDSSLGEQSPTVTDRFIDVIPEGVVSP